MLLVLHVGEQVDPIVGVSLLAEVVIIPGLFGDRKPGHQVEAKGLKSFPRPVRVGKR
jgi:hypothetical protein